MSGMAGTGGLSALGWSGVAAGVAVAGGATLYVAGVFDPKPVPTETALPVEEAVVVSPAPEPVDPPETSVEAEPPVKAPEATPSDSAAVETASAEEGVKEPAVAQNAQSENAVTEEVEDKAPLPENEDADLPVTSDTTEPTPEPQPQPQEEVVEGADDETPKAGVREEDTEPAAPEVAETDNGAEPAPAAPILVAPSFDVVRVEPDGTTLVAGKGTEGSTTSIFVDGEKADEFVILPGGQFVSFLTIGISTQPRVLTMRSRLGDAAIDAADNIIIAPAEPQVAEAEEPAPETTPAPETPVTEDTPAPETPVTEDTPENEPAAIASNEAVSETVEQEPELAPTDANETPEPETVEVTVETAEAAPASPEPEAETQTQEPEVEETPKPVTVIRAGSDGIEVIQSGQDAAVEEKIKVSLGAIVYSETGDVQLSGLANKGSTIRAYVDNRAVVDTLVDDFGRWRTNLPGVEPGIYTLRLDELDRGGSVLSRLETPFKREAPEVLRPQPAPETVATSDSEESKSETGPIVRAITVQTGDTLWAISESRYGDGVQYVRVFEANRDSIRDPDLIYPGQVFNIPE